MDARKINEMMRIIYREENIETNFTNNNGWWSRRWWCCTSNNLYEITFSIDLLIKKLMYNRWIGRWRRWLFLSDNNCSSHRWSWRLEISHKDLQINDQWLEYRKSHRIIILVVDKQHHLVVDVVKYEYWDHVSYSNH